MQHSGHPPADLLTALLAVMLLVAPFFFFWPHASTAFTKGLGAGLVTGMIGMLRLLKRTFAWLLNVGREYRPWRLPSGPGGRGWVLAPGDAAPPASRTADYYDYRGVALERELGALTGDGVPLGHYQHPRGSRGDALALPADLLRRNCAVIGPSGSGKTEGLVVPWILDLLRSGVSVVTCDVKGDLMDRLAPEARRLGRRLWYWNSSDPARSLSWNWLAEIKGDRDIEAAVQSILGRARPNDTQPFFYERDYRWLRALIAVVKDAYRQTAIPHYLYGLIGNQDALRDLFRQCPRVHGHAQQLADLFQFSPDEFGRAVSGLLNALHLFNTASVRGVSERNDMALETITQTPTLLIVGASLSDVRVSEVLSGLMLNQLFNGVYRRFGAGGSGSLPLYFIIDEAPRLKERINFEEVLSVARSAGAGICIAAQDVSQFGDVRQQSAILTNCLTLITLRGVSADTARYFSNRLGQRHERMESATHHRNSLDIFGQRGSTIHSVDVPVLGEREIMHPGAARFGAVVQSLAVSSKPFLVDLGRP